MTLLKCIFENKDSNLMPFLNKFDEGKSIFILCENDSYLI